jgi:hypothetical protein
MSGTSAAFGMRPVYSPSGVVRPTAYTIANGYAANLYQNQPVTIAANGTLTAATVSGRIIGVFQGVEYTDADGRRRVSNKWTASQVGTDIVAYATLDPSIIYEIQSDAALAISNIGEQYNFTAVTGNATTGLSTQMLGVSTSAANGPIRLIGITPGPDNAWGDTYVIAQVNISQHQNAADVAAY